MAAENIDNTVDGTGLINVKIPGLSDAADIQAALRLYHYGIYGYDGANTNPALLPNPSIAKYLKDLIDADAAEVTNRNAAITVHNTATTNVHGIANTANLATQAFVTTSITNAVNGATGGYPALAGEAIDWNSVDLRFDVEPRIANTGTITTKTESFTLSPDDVGKTAILYSSNPITVTLPANNLVEIPVGYSIDIIQTGSGSVTVLEGTNAVSINSKSNIKSLDGQYSKGTLVKIDTNTWFFFGNLLNIVVPTPVAPTPTAPTPVAPTPVAPTPTAPTPVAPTAPTPVAPTAPTPTAPTPVAPTAPTPVAPTAPTPTAPTPTAPTVWYCTSNYTEEAGGQFEWDSDITGYVCGVSAYACSETSYPATPSIPNCSPTPTAPTPTAPTPSCPSSNVYGITQGGVYSGSCPDGSCPGCTNYQDNWYKCSDGSSGVKFYTGLGCPTPTPTAPTPTAPTPTAPTPTASTTYYACCTSGDPMSVNANSSSQATALINNLCQSETGSSISGTPSTSPVTCGSTPTPTAPTPTAPTPPAWATPLSGYHTCTEADAPNPNMPSCNSQNIGACVNNSATGASCPAPVAPVAPVAPTAPTPPAPTPCQTFYCAAYGVTLCVGDYCPSNPTPTAPTAPTPTAPTPTAPTPTAPTPTAPTPTAPTPVACTPGSDCGTTTNEATCKTTVREYNSSCSCVVVGVYNFC